MKELVLVKLLIDEHYVKVKVKTLNKNTQCRKEAVIYE